MNPPVSIRSLLLRLIGPVLTLCLIGYFIYFTLYGERGLTARAELRAERSAQQAQLVELQAKREALEQRVFGLREPTIDDDLLEEQARQTLGYGYAGEQAVLPEGAWMLPGRRPLPRQ